MNKINIFIATIILVSLTQCNFEKRQDQKFLEIPVEVYEEKVYASWLGQMVGNMYGLVHENQYLEEPGPDSFPYGYDYKPLPDHGMLVTKFLKKHNGAFSDDDTDIEYMYLLQMEKHGIEPSYVQLAEAWKYHVRGWVWVANRAALRLMNYGHYPPLTGNKNYNPHWFEIDPQLVNEIWSVTAPGMLDYASEKSGWSAKITSDGIGIEPTIFYAAMYSAAFFETDVEKLIDIGIEALQPDSYFSRVVAEMKELHKKYPDNWKAARAILSQKYWVDAPEEYKSVYNAVLNGAAAVLALLYGEGDFQKTLDLSCAMGFDADNQAASMSGLLGILHGIKGIPQELLYPLEEWTEPFNDQYTNRSRYDLPDASIKDMAKRTAQIGEKIILAHGGEIIMKDNRPYYRIDADAVFKPKLELHPAPLITFYTGTSSRFQLNSSYNVEDVTWNIEKANLPSGIAFHEGVFVGKPDELGTYEIEVTAQLGEQVAKQLYTINVLGENLAPEASSILLATKSEAVGSVTESTTEPSDDPELLRDGKIYPNFYSSYNPENSSSFTDYFGYQWDSDISVSSIIYYTGWMEQHGGWFTSFNVEYLDDNGDWISVTNLEVLPRQNLNNQTFAHAHYVPYLCKFDPVKTKAIRISGQPAGKPAWNHKETVHFANISEIEVY